MAQYGPVRPSKVQEGPVRSVKIYPDGPRTTQKDHEGPRNIYINTYINKEEACKTRKPTEIISVAILELLVQFSGP